MALDDRLTQLQALEVGNVEKVIGDIERTERDTLEVTDRIEDEIQNYRILIEKKLPRIIGNIQTLRSVIFGIDSTFNYSNYNNLHIHRHKKGRLLILDTHHRTYQFQFDFNNDGSESIALLDKAYKAKGLFRREVYDWYDFITAKTPGEFTERYLELVTSQIRNGSSEFSSLPFLLNEVPDSIIKIYEQQKSRNEQILGNIQSEKKKLDGLKEVSDII
ncbi:MAG: hypothetical protein Q8P79_02955 [Nanoarchaeota archaeon]|nr:hypothetical protein [Nanoarchaeota archaeon]